MEDKSSSGDDYCRIPPEKAEEEEGLKLSNLDRLDLVSIFFVMALAFAMAVVLYLAPPPEKGVDPRRGQVVVINPELDRKIEVAERILASDNPRAVSELLTSLKKDFPYDGRVFMLLGDLALRLQNPLKAMHFYRQAVDLNPDFLDKNTKLFQGKKIKGVLAEVEKIIAENPDQKGRKELLYMRRKVAGGCG